jgi:DNA-binding HxlR family transcriptional regulator
MLQRVPDVKKAPPRHLISPRKPRAAKSIAAKPPADPYRAQCPTRMILDRIADKWTVLVLGLLSDHPRRFNQIRREIEGLTQKMLSQTLKALERDGMVSRKVTPTVPISVEYAITPLGGTLAATVDGLRLWAEAHIEDVVTAQKRYDLIGSRSV